MKIHWQEDGSYFFKTEKFIENFRIQIGDGMIEAGLFKVPKGYIRIDRPIRDIDVGTYFIWPIVPFIKIWYFLLDKFDK